MKKIYKSFVAITCLILAFVSIALVGCNNTKVEKITLSKTSLNLVVGNSETLTATITPDDADETITWTTSDKNVATVENGKVMAVAKGEATITAKAGDKEATCKVTVTEAPATVAVESVTIDKDTATVEVDKTVALKATVTPDNATDKTVTWTSDKTNIATVANGVVTGVAAGKAIITAKAGDKTATCAVTVTAASSEPGSSTEFLYGATFALNTPDQKVTIGTAEFTNPKSGSNAALTLTASTKFVGVFELKGATAGTFSADQATAFGGVKTRDNFVVLTLNNPDKEKVEMGWVEQNADGVTFNTTLSNKNPGYNTVAANSTDTDLILWLNRPNRTNYFCVKVGNKVGILDVSGVTLNQFFTTNGKLTLNQKDFTNESTLKIEKQLGANNADKIDVYTVSGKASAFNDNASAFTSDGRVDENHCYINLKLSALAGEKYKSGWVSTPTEALSGSYANVPTASSAVDNDWILWVTDPDEAGKNYFKVDIEGDRSYVLDISNLNTNNNILTVDNGRYNLNSDSVNVNGYHNEHDVHISAEGNVSKITGTATKFDSENSGDHWDSTGTNQRPKVGLDEYIVVSMRLPKIGSSAQEVKWKYGWVKEPYNKLCEGNQKGTNAEWGCSATCEGVREWTVKKDNSNPNNDQSQTNDKDDKLILWVTRQATSGYYLRIEYGYGENNNDGARRAYVYDLSELLSANGNGERVQDFFKVENGTIQLGGSSNNQYKFQNNAASGLRIEKVEGKKNYWKITGNATKFSTNNKGAFPGEVTTEGNSGYVVFRMNVKKSSTNSGSNTDKITCGWIEESNVGKELTLTDSNIGTILDHKGELTTFDWNEPMVMLVNRANRTRNIWCVIVEDDGGKNYYYLDFSGVSKTATDFCADCTESSAG